MPGEGGDKAGGGKPGQDKPHYIGHRERLRERLLTRGGESLSDHEIIEFLLFAAKPRGDTKPLAKALLTRFGSLSAVLAAEPEKLQEVSGMGTASTAAVKIVQEAAVRMARERATKRTVISSWQDLLSYCRILMAEQPVEQFRVLFLDRKNQLIADEAQGRGTVDHTPAYPREVVKRAVALDASSVILVHNHPSGDPSPSRGDVETTRQIVKALKSVEVGVHDHVIITRSSSFSFKSKGML